MYNGKETGLKFGVGDYMQWRVCEVLFRHLNREEILWDTEMYLEVME